MGCRSPYGELRTVLVLSVRRYGTGTVKFYYIKRSGEEGTP